MPKYQGGYLGALHIAHTRDRESSHHGRIVFYPAFLGVGLFYAAFLNVLRFFPAELIPDESFSLFNFMVSFSFSATIFGLLFVVICFAALSERLDFFSGKVQKYAAISIGFVSLLLGCSFLIPLNFDVVLPRIEPSLFGCFFGIGTIIFATLWGRLFSHLEPENILFNSACSLAIGAILHFLGEFLLPSPGGFIMLILLFVVSLALLAFASSRFEQTGSLDKVAYPLKKQISKATHALWMPLIGACLSCFIFGLTWNPIVSDEPARAIVYETIHVWKQLLGPLVAVLPIALMVIKRPDISALRILNQAIYPIAVALLLALPVVISENEALNSVIEIAQQASFSVIILSVWCTMATTVTSSSLKSFFVFPFCFALLALSFGIGLHLIYVIGTDGRTICLLLLALYLALIAISFALSNRSEKKNRETSEEKLAPERTYIQQRCEELNKQYSLSPREREVLRYLGRGYNHGYIATKLYISENTVRTHVRHIYSKLEITSREELITLIDEGEKGRT